MVDGDFVRHGIDVSYCSLDESDPVRFNLGRWRGGQSSARQSRVEDCDPYLPHALKRTRSIHVITFALERGPMEQWSIGMDACMVLSEQLIDNVLWWKSVVGVLAQ